MRITSSGYLMWRPLHIELWGGEAWKTVDAPDPDAPRDGMRIAPGPAQNVAYAYAAFVADVRTGSRRSATFSDALRRHHTIDAIERAASAGAVAP